VLLKILFIKGNNLLICLSKSNAAFSAKFKPASAVPFCLFNPSKTGCVFLPLDLKDCATHSLKIY